VPEQTKSFSMLFFETPLRRVVLFVSIFFCLIMSLSIEAQNTLYQGPATGGSWFTPANWSNGVPTTGVEALILNGDKVIIDQNLTSDFVISSFGTVTINAGVTATLNGNMLTTLLENNGSIVNIQTINVQNGFTNTGSVQNAGTMTLQGSTINSGSLTGAGTFGFNNTMTNTGTFSVSGTVTNNGVWTNSGATSVFDILATATFTNDFGATLTIPAGYTALVYGKLFNTGTLTVNGLLSVQPTALVRNVITANFGATSNLNVLAGATYENQGATTLNGTTVASGTFIINGFSTVTNNGNFSNAGTMDITGTFDNSTSGTFVNATTAVINGQFGSTIKNSKTFNNLGNLNSNGAITNTAGTMTNTGTITAGLGAILTNDAIFLNNGPLNHTNKVINNGTFTNTSSINILSGGQLINNLTFTNSITGQILSQFELINGAAGVFTNNGKVTIEVRMENNGNFTNNAYLLVNGIVKNTATLNNYDLFELASGAFDNSGTLNNFSRFNISVCSEVQNRATGVIANTGIIKNSGILFQKGSITGTPITNLNGFVHTGATSAANICTPTTVGINSDGLGKAYAQGFVNILAIDSCLNFVYLANGLPRPTFPCSAIGSNPISLVVKTPTGDSLTCTTTVNVIDNIAPEFAGCPGNQFIQTVDTFTTATWIPPTVTDVCTVTPTLTVDKLPGSIFKIGINSVTYLATDASGNSNACQFKITVQQVPGPSTCAGDVAAPVFANCPANITVAQTAPNSDMPVFWTIPTATDACKPLNISSNFVPGADFPTGPTTVTYKAVDGNNNTGTCSFTVTVTVNNPCLNDTQKPQVANCPANIYLPGNINSNTAVVTWTPPNFNDACPLTVTSNLQPGVILSTSTASTTVTYTATDASGNTAVCAFNILVGTDPCAGDVTGPVFSGCPANIVKTTTTFSSTATWTAPSATDACGGVTLSSNFVSGATFGLGSTTVVYQASDAKGNTSTCTFTVTVDNVCVGEQVSPVFAGCPASIATATAPPATSAVATWTAPTATDNCSSVAITNSHQPGSFFPVGQTIVTYSVSDQSGNTANCTFFVTVSNGNTSVSINCPANITIAATSTAGAVVTYTTPTATNNGCTGAITVSRTAGLASGASFSVGVNTVTYQATNTCGNLITCSFTVTVQPFIQTGVSIVCPANITIAATSAAGAAVTYSTPTATNTACTGTPTVTKTVGLASGSAFPVGVNTVAWQATNTCGNTSTCSFTITVTAFTTPSVAINCPVNINVTATTAAGAVVSYTTPTATNTNCTGTPTVTKTAGLASGVTFPIGVSTITYQATNSCGNTATCSFTVTVFPVSTGQSVGDKVFNDLNNNGLQDAGEPGVQYVGVIMTTATGGWIGWSGTDANGVYNFNSTTIPQLVAGQYKICITAPWNLPNASAKDVGTNDAIDSDFGAVVGGSACSDIFTLATGQNITNLDGGFTTGVVQQPCTLTSIVSNIQCNNNGTPALTTDDTFTFTVLVNSNGSCSGGWTSGTSSGSYGSSANFGPFPISGGNKTLTFTSTTGQTTTATAITPAPCSGGTTSITMSCPSNVVVTATSQTGAVANFTAPTATTTCSSPATVTQTSGSPSGSVFPIGTTIITYSATNTCGNSTTCAFTVTVNPQVVGGTQTIGDKVFNDLNNNGLQEAGEPGAPFIGVTLFTAAGGWVAWAGTDANGIYNFNSTTTPALVPGQYKACINAPWNLPIASPKDAGTNDALDSDFNVVTGGVSCTDNFTLASGQTISNLDAGFTNGVVPPSCSISAVVSNVQCNNNGTATVTTDDTYTFSVSVSSNGACTGGWTSGTTSGTYGSATTFGPFPISGGNKTLVFTSSTGQTTSVTAIAPATCSSGTTSITLTCPTNITVTATSVSGAVVSFSPPTSTTTCATPVSVNQTSGLPTGSTFPVGTTTINYTATNACGNTAACSFTVTVNPQVVGGTQSIGDKVFNDLNNNGLQDPGEPGVQYVGVNLTTATGGYIGWAGTDANGNFNFTSTAFPALVPGQYKFCVAAPWNLPNASVKDAGTNDAIDSDVNAVVGGSACTDVFTLASGQNISNLDAGFTTGVVQQPCSITSIVSNIQCNNNGTPTVTSDDTYTFTVLVNSNGSCTGGWTSGTASGSYGASANFGPFLISGGNKTLVFTSTTGQTTSATAIAPAPCSSGTTSVTMNCPSNITVTATSTSGAVVSFATPTATTTCSGTAAVSLSAGLPSGSTFPVGTSTVTFFATNNCGNTTTCAFTVTVNPQSGGNGQSIGDKIFNDLNSNGMQEAGEPGVQFVGVTLTTAAGGWIGWSGSDANGNFGFNSTTTPNLVPGQYKMCVTPPWNLPNASVKDAGTNDNLDSDVNPVTGGTACFDIITLAAGQQITNLDAGFTSGTVQNTCAVTAIVSNIVCSNNGTPNLSTDDTYKFNVTINSNGFCTGSWLGGGLSGNYNTTTTFGPYPISGGNQTLTFTSVSGQSATVTAIAPATCSTPTASCAGAIGTMNREKWNGLPTSLTDWNTIFSTQPSSTTSETQYKSPSSIDDNYASRMRGFIRPTATGVYTFAIAGDDNCQLLLNTSGTSTTGATQICTINGFTIEGDLTKYPSQTSVNIVLNANTDYYVEMRQREWGGGDFFNVYWKTPTNSTFHTIPGANMKPWTCAYNAQLVAQTMALELTQAPGQVDLQWAANKGTENDMFFVERMNLNNGEFDIIGYQAADKSSDEASMFNLTDIQPVVGENRYRIRLKKNDGSEVISDEKMAIVTDMDGVAVFPNPARSEVFVTMDRYMEHQATVTLTDAMGRNLLSDNIETVSDPIYKMSVNDLPEGTYFILIRSQGFRDVVRPIMIRR
jgi:SdrD B-like domain/HYR domain/PA14 domain/Secretion system C-terminal sorting domain